MKIYNIRAVIFCFEWKFCLEIIREMHGLISCRQCWLFAQKSNIYPFGLIFLKKIPFTNIKENHIYTPALFPYINTASQ